MIRAFVAVEVPAEARSALHRVQARLPLPRIVDPDNLHLTLAFLGPQPAATLEELHSMLDAIHGLPFALQIDRLATFGGAEPRNLHAGFAASEPLAHLARKVGRAAEMSGIRLERRRFVPHVTLARFRPHEIEPERLARALAAVEPLRLAAFVVEEFVLYRSWLHSDGADYEVLERYALR